MRNGGQQRNSESEYKAQIRRRGKVLNQEEKKKKKNLASLKNYGGIPVGKFPLNEKRVQSLRRCS